MVELTKEFIVVYKVEKTIVFLLYDNVLTYPGGDDLFAEFDTAEELDLFLISEGLIEVEKSVVSKTSKKSR